MRGRAAEEVRITRKTLLELPDPQPLAPSAPQLPDHTAYQQIMADFVAADATTAELPVSEWEGHDPEQLTSEEFEEVRGSARRQIASRPS
ncbi:MULTISPECIES: hypothetical protein [unclassified Streptomyces]|uniref:Uncharacterized protein n=1 Tax=Streptomyces sp. NBC_00119 TaxID=2975659 RepID=A0AAU1ULE5_9ACTN|nr:MULTISPECIES: hypothetical protein [unclassified Streptomyces]MCX4649582.1 hypothetical protein [Streptomyces sp. NBC_01446]MCX5321212.1 hypothetical protein [Streptomyces sp. NBC_00120]